MYCLQNIKRTQEKSHSWVNLYFVASRTPLHLKNPNASINTAPSTDTYCALWGAAKDGNLDGSASFTFCSPGEYLNN